MTTKNSKNDIEIKEVRRLSDLFAHHNGRRPRILLAEPTRSTAMTESKLNASFYANLGFDVDIPPPFENAKDIVKQAIESDVHVLFIVSDKDNKKVHGIIKEFDYYENKLVKIVLLTDVTDKDYKYLLRKGIAAIFPKQTNTTTIAKEILKILLEN